MWVILEGRLFPSRVVVCMWACLAVANCLLFSASPFWNVGACERVGHVALDEAYALVNSPRGSLVIAQDPSQAGKPAHS